jgi:membrane protein implicated in regulation of membrane protease activity
MNALAMQQPAWILALGHGGRVALAGGVTAVALAAVLANFLLAIGALVSVLRSRLGGGMKFLWVMFVFVAPFLGSLAWFVIGRRDAEQSRRR